MNSLVQVCSFLILRIVFVCLLILLGIVYEYNI